MFGHSVPSRPLALTSSQAACPKKRKHKSSQLVLPTTPGSKQLCVGICVVFWCFVLFCLIHKSSRICECMSFVYTYGHSWCVCACVHACANQSSLSPHSHVTLGNILLHHQVYVEPRRDHSGFIVVDCINTQKLTVSTWCLAALAHHV